MSKKELKAYNLSEEYFNKILDTYNDYVVKVNVNTFEKFTKGGNFKNSIIFDGTKKLVITQIMLFHLLNDEEKAELKFQAKNNWIQCICYKKVKQKKAIVEGLSGGIAYRQLKNKICKYYSEEEFDLQLRKFEKEYDPNKVQYHFEYQFNNKKIQKYENCKKYDINGAYAKALTLIFPKAEFEIKKLYEERKINPENKDLINYFVGMLCKKGYRNTFNWIVQKIRKQIEDAINYVDGILLYANTDGFAVTYESQALNTSKDLGDFKLEYEGNLYTYTGDNYWIFQTETGEVTGNILYQVRDYIDLKDGITVEYTRVKTDNTYKAENIQIVKREIE